MRDAALRLLRCPVDGHRLQRVDDRVRCPAGHSTDLAAHGYLNLLGGPPPANADTPAMLASRVAAHTAGCFAPLQAAIAATVDRTLAEVAAPVVIDLGAGPGSYLAALLEEAPTAEGLAIDVSKHAARRAARCHARASAVVADVWRSLPVADASADVLLDVFAPRNADEFVRLLRPGGRLVVVVPGPEHLHPLPEALELVRVRGDKERDLDALTSEALEAEERRQLRWTRELTAEVVADLVLMGPSAHHVDPDELRQRIHGLDLPVVVTFDVTIASWRRRTAA